MYRYKVKISYLVAGERVTKYVIGFYSSATEAAEEVRQEYADAPGIRVEKVWVDIGTWWKSNEVEPKTVEKEEKMVNLDEFMDKMMRAYKIAVREKDNAQDQITYTAARARMTALDDAMLWALECKAIDADTPEDTIIPEMENPVP